MPKNFIILNDELCNLENVDHISFDSSCIREVGMGKEEQPVSCEWFMEILYESGNRVTNVMVKGDAANQEEFEELESQFQKCKVIIIQTIKGDDGFEHRSKEIQ